jgi:predicted glycogen debranching enzyme
MDLSEFSHYEWVVSNRRGGYALGPPSLLNHRKYHGLLVAAQPDLKRIHLVSSVEEVVKVGDDLSFLMDSNTYPNVVFPQGYRHIFRYFLRPFPAFLFSTTPVSSEIMLLKSIQMHEDLNFCVVKYRNLGAFGVSLTLRPKFTLRSHHAVHAPGFWDTASHFADFSGQTGIVFGDGQQAFLYSKKGTIESDLVVYRNVVYPSEMIRGYESAEDLLGPFRIDVELEPGDEEVLVFGDTGEEDFGRIAEEADERYRRWPLPINHPLALKDGPEGLFSALTARGERAFDHGQYIKMLELSVSEFFCENDLIAGFPWFSAWGRDAMISLEAFEYIPGGVQKAYSVFLKYGRNMKDGLIPNTLGEGGIGRNYETVDASLWFGLRILDRWEQFSEEQKEILIHFVYSVIGNYLLNESLPFHVDARDGLIDIRHREDLALTWMDAKVHGQPVTPRWGKPVEVNALWFNLLESFLRIAGVTGQDSFRCGEREVEIDELAELSKKTKASLRGFFYGHGFADRIEEKRLEKEVRPNYVIALSLPDVPFEKEEVGIGYELAKKELFVKYGLRSLSPTSRAYRKRYMGNQTMRDMAYHQGTAWVWLLLPMAKLAAKVYSGDDVHLRRELLAFASPFRDRFVSGEMASIPELYDGDSPRIPKGAPAQCWSTAAVFIIEKMLEKLR